MNNELVKDFDESDSDFGSNKFGSIDTLVNHYKHSYKSKDASPASNVYEYLICYETQLVLSVLRLKTNRPSKYDLMLIKEINKTDGDGRFVSSGHWVDIADRILGVYRNRK